MMLRRDDWIDHETSRNQMRRDLAAMGVENYRKLFPEYIPVEVTPVNDSEITEEEADAMAEGVYGGPVRYEAPKDEEMTPEKYNELLASLMAGASTGTATGADIEYGPWH